MAGRWDELPPSEQEQQFQHLLATTAPANISVPFRKNVGELLKQEIAESNQVLCYYRNVANGNPITYICDLGCCPTGCCAAEEMVGPASSFGWAITLLVVFLGAVVVVLITFTLLYLLNRYNDRKYRDQMTDSSVQSSVGSQISGPTFYGHDAYYPYVTNIETY
ncbi:hypothetical protein L596_003417 [Steinernema carpocapsae]|uniref:CX domain-containing protein n=1 Tax=Steinernema carpocapsae TaxID=34508 RepID=A0A4U8USI7_STECR|nr:hypothetical protein L596_003417 [Steinernema carpocapsae]